MSSITLLSWPRMKVYELQPEASSLQFRDARKKPWDTCVDCFRYLEETFKKCLLLEDVDGFKSLKELIIMEQFTNLADKKMGTNIREKRFKYMNETIAWTDDRVLDLWASGSKHARATHYIREKSAGGEASSDKNSCQVKEMRGGERTTLAKTPSSSSKVTCFYCKQVGHTKLECAK